MPEDDVQLEKSSGAENGDAADVSAAPDSQQATWHVTEWRGKMIVDRNGEKIGKLQDVYVDVETDEPQFGTVKEGFL